MRTRAPTRVDLGGGWTDVPPYAEEQGGFVCNVAIDRYATVTVTPLDRGDDRGADRGDDRGDDRVEIAVASAADRALVAAVAHRGGARGVRIELHNDFPVRAGLGGSSAASVALIAALRRGTQLSGGALAEFSRQIETEDLGVAGGRQDHYASVFGGALGLGFSANGVAVERIPLADTTRAEFESRAMIVYTGESRISGDTIVAVLDAYRAGSRGVCDALAAMGRLAREMRTALSAGDIDGLSALVDEQWHHQRMLHPAIPTPRIDEIISRARAAGANGGKALGASGGGCVLLFTPADHAQPVREAVAPLGTLLPFHVDREGVRVCD